MASLPPSQRKHSPPQRTDSELPIEIRRSDSEAQSTISEDSQTVLLNPSSVRENKPEEEEKEKEKEKEKNQQEDKQSEEPATAPQDEVDPRRCWICFTDETEDTPTSSEWRSPCPCALTAHETCLLDWIADMEMPSSRRPRGPRDKILCPQCKSEIVLARPRSYVVDAVRSLEIMGSRLVLPGVLTVGLASFYSLCWAHGAQSVAVVFGAEDAERILAPLFWEPPGNTVSVQQLWAAIKMRWRIDIGLALIPPILVCSRGTYADSILPILPMLFFVTKPDPDPLLDLGTWPPSAGLSFALLPYIRAIYNGYYERVWAKRERRWLQEIQPRASTEGQDENEPPRQNLDNEDNVLEINVDLGILDEWDGDEREEQDEQDRQEQEQNEQIPGLPQAHPLNAPPLDELGAAPDQQGIPAVAPALDAAQGQQQGGVAPAAPAPQVEGRGNFNLAVSTNKLAESILGALAFPAVSAAMGELLRITLPRALTSRVYGAGGKPTGILQMRWGRSIVGGCLFVVLKDAVMLYVRWRMAQNHRMRKVLDYDRQKPGRSVPPGGSR